MNPLLSIIIPTRNRYSTLLPVLDFLTTIQSDDFEIVVQDNSTDNSLMEKELNRRQDSRIKYFYQSANTSQGGNSDLAVGNAIGDYICFIGDDDGVMPYIVNVVKWMKLNGIKILKGRKPDYYWPLLSSTSTSTEANGILKWSNYSYRCQNILCEKVLNELLKTGGTDMGSMPSLYHGIVHRDVLNQIRKKTGSYFPGPSPDMANAVALTLFEEYFTYVDFPVVISGKSINSIGGQGVLHKHVNKIEDVTHLPSDTLQRWHVQIPKYWTGETIWAESVLQSLERCGYSGLKNKLNVQYLYAATTMFNYPHRREIFSNFSTRENNANYYLAFATLFYKRGTMFLKNRLSFLGQNSTNNLQDISRAIIFMSKKVEMERMPFYVTTKKADE